MARYFCCRKSLDQFRCSGDLAFLAVEKLIFSLRSVRKALSIIVNGKAGISPEMAVRLSIAFNISSESWINQQSQYDLWPAEQHRSELHVSKLFAA